MNVERSSTITESRLHKPHPDLAWQPDLLETFGVAKSISRLNNFSPLEPNPDRAFITATSIVAHVLSGGRGAGKSTLLYFRSHFLHSQKDVAFVRDVPPNGFFLKARSIPIPKSALVQFSKVEAWTAAWKLVLGLIFAVSIKRRLDAEHPQLGKEMAVALDSNDNELTKKLLGRLNAWVQAPHDVVIEGLVTEVLEARPSKLKLAEMLEAIKPVLAARNAFPHISTWLVVVDRIDEALATHDGAAALLSGSSNSAYTENDKIIAGNVAELVHQLWRSAQAGYAIASHELRSDSNGQLVAMGTMRVETYPTFLAECGLPKSKVASFVLDLGDDEKRREELMRGIFRLNVNLLEKNDLCPTASELSDYDAHVDANLELFGYEQLYSRAVVGYHETPYDFLCRHSFGTPRGLMQLGNAVARVSISEWPGMGKKEWRAPTKIIEAVNKAAVDVYEEYRDSLFPRWDEDYEAGFNYFRSNVISYEELFRDGGAVDLFSRNAKGAKKDSLVTYLFNAGLLGIPLQSSESRTGWIQGFSAPDQVKVCPARFAYAMLHPAFSAWLVAKIPRDAAAVFYNRQIVVCPGAPCPELMPDPLLRLKFQQSENSGWAKGSVAHNSSWEDVFVTATSVGSALVCVLAVAHRFEGGGHLGSAQLQATAKRLARMRYIPDRLGNSSGKGAPARKSPAEWIEQLCSNDSDSESHSLQSGRELFKNKSSKVTIDPQETDDGRRFCLYLRSKNVARPLEPEEILIEGLSIDAWFKAEPGNDPK